MNEDKESLEESLREWDELDIKLEKEMKATLFSCFLFIATFTIGYLVNHKFYVIDERLEALEQTVEQTNDLSCPHDANSFEPNIHVPMYGTLMYNQDWNSGVSNSFYLCDNTMRDCERLRFDNPLVERYDQEFEGCWVRS